MLMEPTVLLTFDVKCKRLCKGMLQYIESRRPCKRVSKKCMMSTSSTTTLRLLIEGWSGIPI